MSRLERLQENIGRLKSRVGGFLLGERAIFRGQDLHADLSNVDWIDLYVFGITGRRFSQECLRLMHALWVNTSYPDARIWNNRVAALAGSARSTGNLGISAALAVSEAHIYGRGNEVQAITFYIATKKSLDTGGSLHDCVAREIEIYRRVAGYGRPLVNTDERIAPTMALAKRLGLDEGPHVQLAFAVERFLLDSGRNLRMNYGALVSAFGADFGMSPTEFYLFMFPSFLAGMAPCYLDAAGRPEGSLFPVPCINVAYEGPVVRRWPQAADEIN